MQRTSKTALLNDKIQQGGFCLSLFIFAPLNSRCDLAQIVAGIRPVQLPLNRTITMPLFLADEIQEYLKMQYDIGLDDRLFPITKSYLYREMQRSCKSTGVKSDFIVFYLNRKCLGFCMRSQCACRSTPAPGRSAALTARWSACPHQNGGSNNTRFSAWCGTAHDRSSHRRFCG